MTAETRCRSLWSYACGAKEGSEESLVDQIVADMETIGSAEERIIVKTDQESSNTELQRSIANARTIRGTWTKDNETLRWRQ